MDTIEENIENLLEAVRRSDVYQEYQKQSRRLNQNPELKNRVDTFREENFRFQNESDKERLFPDVEDVIRESAQLRKNPEVNAYLDAELALCRLVQKICRSVTEGIDIDVPNM